jgi:hypothetical protein
MQALIDVTLPIFGIMLAGYLSGRFRLLGQDSTAALNGFVYFVALPALFIKAMAGAPFQDILNGPFLAAWYGGQLGVFALALLVATFFFTDRLGAVSMNAIAAVFANTGYMGIPLLMTAFGDIMTLPAVIVTVANGAVVMAFLTAILEVDRAQGRAMKIAKDVAVGVVKSPLVLSAALGLTLSAFRVPIPGPVDTFLGLLGDAAGPCALFAMGLFLVGQSIRRGAVEVMWVSVLKLIAHPLLTWFIATELLEMPPHFVAAAVIMAALPTGSLIFVVGERYGIYVQRAAAIILVSTVASVPTVSFVVQHYVSG